MNQKANTGTTNADEWPENPDAAWLGAWAAKRHDMPFVLNLSIVREIYQQKRLVAISEVTEDQA